MKPARHSSRLISGLAGSACAWLGLAVAAPAAFAAISVPPPTHGSATITRLGVSPGWYKHPQPPGNVVAPSHVHIVVIGGMPGWQIALIAAGTALLAATAAVLAYRAWTTRPEPVTTALEPEEVLPGAADVLSFP